MTKKIIGLLSFLAISSLNAQTPGGVATTNMTMWLSGDENVSVDGVTGQLNWGARVGTFGAYQLTPSNQPSQSELFNYNQTFTFDSVNDYLALQSFHYPSGSSITDLYAFIIFRTSHGGGTYNQNWSLLDFDKSEAYTLYVRSDNGRLGMSFPNPNVGSDVRYDASGTTAANDNRPHLGTFIFDDDLGLNETQIRLDGDLQRSANYTSLTALETRDIRYGIIGDGSESTLEDGDRNDLYYDGEIAEIILFDKGSVTNTEVLKIESYLALKYGITLDSSNSNYLDSQGNVVWASDDLTNYGASSETEYWNNISGVINDNVTGALDQRIGSSGESNLVVSLDGDFSSANNDSGRTTTLSNDGDYLLFGDNGETGFEEFVSGGSVLNVLRTKWLFKEGANDTGTVFIAMPMDAFGEDVTIEMLVSNDDVFDSSDLGLSPDGTTGDYYYWERNMVDGERITFTQTDSKIAGISVTRFDMILRADKGLNNTGSLLTWEDGSFNETNGFVNSVAGIPDSSTNFMNFNPTITFDGVSDFISLQNKVYLRGHQISNLHTYVVYSTDYNEEDEGGSSYDANWSFYDFDRSDAYNMYIQPNGTLSFSYSDDDDDSVLDPSSTSLGNDGLPHIAEFVFNAALTNESVMKFDGNVEFEDDLTSGNIYIDKNRYGFIGDGSEASTENGNRNNNYYEGNISELILADRESFTATENLQVQSYLALKYGVSLNVNVGSYLNSAGLVLWDNLTYFNGVAGLIKDDADSDLDQRIAQSTSALDIIVATDLDFVSGNLDHISRPTSLTEGSSLLFGNDGSGTGIESLSGGAALDFVTARKWLFKEVGTDSGIVHIAIPKSFLPDEATGVNYIISTDDNFTTEDTSGSVTDDGVYYHFSLNIADGDRLAFTFNLPRIPSPGNISQNLQMWIKADKNVVSASNIVTSIGDSGIQSNDLTQSTNLDKPELVNDGTFNFNPSISFNGTRQHFAVTDLSYKTSGSVTEVYSWIVYSTTNTDVTNGSFISFDGDEYFDFGVSGATGNLDFSYTTSGGTNNNVGTTSTNDGTTKVAAFIHDTANVNETIIRLNGVEEFSGDIDNNAIGSGNTRFGYVGDGSTATSFDEGEQGDYFEGNIAELIYYQGNSITTGDFTRIETYLALKYGFTLSGDYTIISADDVTETTIWNSTTNAAYQNNIVGLIREDASELEQKQSKSFEDNSILTVSINSSIATTNDEITGTFTNKDYLLIGNNGGGTEIGLATIPGTASTGECLKSDKQINRDWLVSASGAFSDLTLSFDLTGIVDPNNYKLVVDSDEDNDFTIGTVNTEYTGTLTDDELLFTGVDLENGDVFRLESIEKTGEIIYGNGIWFGGSGIDNAPFTSDTGKSIQILSDVTLPTDVTCDCVNIEEDVIVTISDGNYLHLENEIKFESSASSLYLLGDAELIQTGTGTSPNENTGGGSIYKVINDATESRYIYNYLSSPVNTSGTFTIGGNLKFNTGATLGDNTDPTFNKVSNEEDASGTTLVTKWMHTMNNALAFTEIDETETMDPGIGFTMKGTGGTDTNYNFIGSPNNGTISVPLTSGNFLLTGNPYPSTIDAGAFNDANISTNGGATEGIIYLWDQANTAITAHSQNNGDENGGYATITGNISVASATYSDGATPVTGATIPDHFIRPGQGFIVYGDATGNVEFTNALRATSNDRTAHFFSTNGLTTINPLLRLGFEFTNSSNITYHRQIASSLSGGTMDKEIGKDAFMFDYNANDMYWVLPNEADRFVITDVPYVSDDLELSLGVVVDQEREVTFKIDEVKDLDSSVYLLDKETQSLVNLSSGDYSLILDSGDYQDRFSIVFGEQVTLSDDELSTTKVVLGVENEELSITLENDFEIQNIEIYSISGTNVLSSELSESKNNAVLNIANLSNQVYIARLTTNKGLITKKFIIK